jgi:hypothetical protein
MHKSGQRCTDLLEATANALSGSIIGLMFLSVQKNNLELNINQAVKWYVRLYKEMRMRGADSCHRAHSAFQQGGTTERVIKICILAFPSTWVSCDICVLNCLLLKRGFPLSFGSVHSCLFCHIIS